MSGSERILRRIAENRATLLQRKRHLPSYRPSFGNSFRNQVSGVPLVSNPTSNQLKGDTLLTDDRARARVLAQDAVGRRHRHQEQTDRHNCPSDLLCAWIAPSWHQLSRGSLPSGINVHLIHHNPQLCTVSDGEPGDDVCRRGWRDKRECRCGGSFSGVERSFWSHRLSLYQFPWARCLFQPPQLSHCPCPPRRASRSRVKRRDILGECGTSEDM